MVAGPRSLRRLPLGKRQTGRGIVIDAKLRLASDEREAAVVSAVGLTGDEAGRRLGDFGSI